MEENFTNIAQKIEQRRLSLIEALKREAQAIDKAETKLGKHYNESVRSVYNSLIFNMEEQGNELSKEFKRVIDEQNNQIKENLEKQTELITYILKRQHKAFQHLRDNNIKTYHTLLKYLLPFTLLAGLTIGALAMWKIVPNKSKKIDLSQLEITKARDGTDYIKMDDLILYLKTTKEVD